MSQHIVWSCGAARRDKIICIERLGDGTYELELEDAVPCAVLAPEDGAEVLRQLRSPTADLDRVTDVAIRFGQSLAEHPAPGKMFTAPGGWQVLQTADAAQQFAAALSEGDRETAKGMEVTVRPVTAFDPFGREPLERMLRVSIDHELSGRIWDACLPHAAARPLLRELESYLKLHG